MSKPNTYIKKLGLDPVQKRTKKVLRERIRILKANLEDGKYKGKLAERAEVYLAEHRKALKAS